MRFTTIERKVTAQKIKDVKENFRAVGGGRKRVATARYKLGPKSSDRLDSSTYRYTRGERAYYIICLGAW
jgi:hypothetical protein